MDNQIKVSKREREILTSISQGSTTNQMAVKYHISPHTVTQHRKRLIRKFKVPNSTALVRAGFERGILTLPLS